MHNVVLVCTAESAYKGTTTWTSFTDKDCFKRWVEEAPRLYRVLEEGVSVERAVELCSTKEATLKAGFAPIKAAAQRVLDILKQSRI
jgi:hypothetical protein